MNEAGWLLLGMFGALAVGVGMWWVCSVRPQRRHYGVPPPAVWRSGRPPIPPSAPAYKRQPRNRV